MKHCYLCGVALTKENRTKDHIPPKQFFPDPKPDNLWTVPCCREHNVGEFSPDDEKIRTFLCASEGVSEQADWVFNNPVMRSLTASRKLQAELVASTTKVWRLTPGGLYQPAMKMEFDGV